MTLKLRTCSKCKFTIPTANFYIRANNRYYSSCKKCLSIQRKNRYLNHKTTEEYKARQRASKKERKRALKENIRRLKEKTPCYDCHENYPYYVMDFDHRDGEIKEGNVATLLGDRWAIEKLTNEIAKCDIVCANCHRKRTYQRNLKKGGLKIMKEILTLESHGEVSDDSKPPSCSNNWANFCSYDCL